MVHSTIPRRARNFVPLPLTPLAHGVGIYPCPSHHRLTLEFKASSPFKVGRVTIACVGFRATGGEFRVELVEAMNPRCSLLAMTAQQQRLSGLSAVRPYDKNAFHLPIALKWVQGGVQVYSPVPRTIGSQCRCIPSPLAPLAHSAGIYPRPSHHWITVQ
eukprot:5655193-Pyramimonas_sp.AAC.2